MSSPDTKSGEMSDGARVFCFFFGIYLVIGAGFTVHEGKWFIGFPPQLDLAYFLFGASTVGAYVEATLAGFLGVIFILGSAKRKSNAV